MGNSRVAALLIGGAVVTVSMSVDGFGMKALAVAAQAAPATETAAALRVAIAVDTMDLGIWSIGMLNDFCAPFARCSKDRSPDRSEQAVRPRECKVSRAAQALIRHEGRPPKMLAAIALAVACLLAACDSSTITPPSSPAGSPAARVEASAPVQASSSSGDPAPSASAALQPTPTPDPETVRKAAAAGYLAAGEAHGRAWARLPWNHKDVGRGPAKLWGPYLAALRQLQVPADIEIRAPRFLGQIRDADLVARTRCAARHAEASAAGGWRPFGDTTLTSELAEANREANMAITSLSALVLDDEVRQLCREVLASAAQIWLAQSPDEADRGVAATLNAATTASSRCGDAFRESYLPVIDD